MLKLINSKMGLYLDERRQKAQNRLSQNWNDTFRAVKALQEETEHAFTEVCKPVSSAPEASPFSFSSAPEAALEVAKVVVRSPIKAAGMASVFVAGRAWSEPTRPVLPLRRFTESGAAATAGGEGVDASLPGAHLRPRMPVGP